MAQSGSRLPPYTLEPLTHHNSIRLLKLWHGDEKTKSFAIFFKSFQKTKYIANTTPYLGHDIQVACLLPSRSTKKPRVRIQLSHSVSLRTFI